MDNPVSPAVLAALDKALSALPERQVFALHCWHDIGYDGIARILRIEVNDVAQAMASALSRLQGDLDHMDAVQPLDEDDQYPLI